MPKAGFRPYATIEEGLDQYIGYNFARAENMFERMRDPISGNTTVTGTAIVATGLAYVDNVVACLATSPAAGACFVTASPGSAAGTIDLRVFSNTFAASTVGVVVRWIAIGELILT